MKGCPAILVCLFLTATSSVHAQTAEAQKGFVPLTAALHVHSRFSNGDNEILELASAAHERKLDILGLTDSYLTRVRYGIWPFRRLLSRTMSRPGIVDRGIDAYFDNARGAQARFPDVVVLPGLEVTPYYYWQGRWPENLELHDFDRHLIIFGMGDANAIRNLPLIENASWANTERDWMRAAGPISAGLGGVLLLLISRGTRARLLRILGLLVLAVGLIWGFEAYPFSELPDPYTGKHSDQPYQRLISYANDHGALPYWSYPEAKYPDIQLPGARMISRGRPEILAQTASYRGFEGLYGDRITITEAGNLWDQLLLDYVRNGRDTWPSVISGIDFHSFRPGNGWYQLDQGVTVLLAKDKSQAGVLDALKQGRGYSTFQENPAQSLVLEDFALRANGRTAISGETLTLDTSTVNFSATVAWKSGDSPTSNDVAHARLIRDGTVLEDYSSALPLSIARTDELEPGRHYYRIMVEYGHTQIVSNPLFCVIKE